MGQLSYGLVVPARAATLCLTQPFFRFFVFEDPNWDYKTFRFNAPRTASTATSIIRIQSWRALFNAVNPDLSQFRARGGKLIHYHGWSDPDITPLNSVNYCEEA